MKASNKTATPTPAQTKSSKAALSTSNWQATFSKRLPHRIGQPLSSGGGGDGCAAPAGYASDDTPR